MLTMVSINGTLRSITYFLGMLFILSLEPLAQHLRQNVIELVDTPFQGPKIHRYQPIQ
jgi:hypothetical protein